jgi:hypothetical protein
MFNKAKAKTKFLVTFDFFSDLNIPSNDRFANRKARGKKYQVFAVNKITIR